MLAAVNRLGDATSFREVSRRGRRAATTTLVVHVLVEAGRAGGSSPDASPPVVGLVVSRAVGNSVVRNRVKRRLRHLVRVSIAELPPGGRVVVRALPAAARASSASLSLDLDRALAKTLAPARGVRS